MSDLQSRFEDGAVVAGVLSGTSADGIDVVLARMHLESGTLRRPEVLEFTVEDFPEDVRGRVRAALDGAPIGPRELALLSRDLGRAFGRAALASARRAGVELDLVGSHGQTVWHHDGREGSGPATLQLGDGDFVAEEVRCTVASDFRQRDIAAGGEGAPLSALADPLLFAEVPRPFAVLNLGGMANLTWVGAGEGELLAFDTGPAGSLLDGIARRRLDEPFDREGLRASRGRFHSTIADEFAAHPFFRRAPPKSTGRDTFGERFVDEFVERGRQLSTEDLLATAVGFVAGTIRDAMARFLPAPPTRLVGAGGGLRNGMLMRSLAALVDVPVEPSSAYGVDPKAREALVFAVLGARCALGIPSTHPGATGARAGRVLGKLSSP